MYLLDTNIVSDFIHRPRGAIARRISAVGEASVAVSIIVAAELRFGAARRGASPRLVERVQIALEILAVLPLGDDADVHYGLIRADLERRGCLIGNNDMLIAAHALSLGATLVTANVREFQRVAGVSIENWLHPA